MLRSLFTCFAALALSGACAAEKAPRPEPALELTGRVVDAADVLGPEFEVEMTRTLAKLEKDTLVQLVVATTPSLDGKEIEQYSLELARAWGIGSEERDDGLMLLVAPNERTLRIEVGYGLERSVEDDEAALILSEEVLPNFEKGDYEAGIAAGVESLVREVTPVQLKEAA